MQKVMIWSMHMNRVWWKRSHRSGQGCHHWTVCEEWGSNVAPECSPRMPCCCSYHASSHLEIHTHVVDCHVVFPVGALQGVEVGVLT